MAKIEGVVADFLVWTTHSPQAVHVLSQEEAGYLTFSANWSKMR